MARDLIAKKTPRQLVRIVGMQFRLRTLLIATAIVLPLMATEWFLIWGPSVDGFFLWWLSMVLLYQVLPAALVLLAVLLVVWVVVAVLRRNRST